MTNSAKRSSPNSPDQGVLLVLSGPSGVGKSTIVEALDNQHEFAFSVSATTRAARTGEKDGVDYYFVSDDEFQRMIDEGELLEWAEYSGHRYGTPASPLISALADGSDVLLDIENWGARQVKEAYPEALTVFIVPPSMDELERRLRGRGDTDAADVTARLAVAAEQIADAAEHYDAVVVGDTVERATSEIMRILTAHEEGSHVG